MSTESVRDRIVGLLEGCGLEYDEYHHQPCASSEESARTREAAGAGHTVGAKALLVKSKKGVYSVCTIPGHARLDSKKLRKLIGKHSFATSAEMEQLTDGLKPGHMPPFGPQLFTGITNLIVDPNVHSSGKIGFNAGDPTISIVMSGKVYQCICGDSCTVGSITIDD